MYTLAGGERESERERDREGGSYSEDLTAKGTYSYVANSTYVYSGLLQRGNHVYEQATNDIHS